ncbi:signal recognition particle [Streptomyces sp. YIM 98790]|uniref:pPIWI_RE_Z domain-containing protein n=1 Tax=Streptomyces sp. YIM 98790 TaxID=2689077 RepID=UPI00140C54B9|nr:signal recognition particle [Streptomyces sp. YIM 98790]
MRDRSGWHRRLARELRDVWPESNGGFDTGDLLDVELGLYLLETVMPARTALDAWTLFGGYPYGEVFGDVRTEEQRLRIRRGRHYLWEMRRPREWALALDAYRRMPQALRGYELDGTDRAPVRRSPSRAAGRFAEFERLLTHPPEFLRVPMPVAGAGEHRFAGRDRNHSVDITRDLLPAPEPEPHRLDELPPGGGKPIEVTWEELAATARRMDELEAGLPDGRRGGWERRLDRVRLLVRNEAEEAFTASDALRVDGLLHLVGMVGAGKSTLRDILTFWAATERGLRITVVVSDVAETLAVVGLFQRLGVRAAPVLGHSTRERHIQRLHRRIATSGAETVLTHRHPGFVHLSSACPLDALRGLEADRALRIADAPCTALFPVVRPRRPDSRALVATGSGAEPGQGEEEPEPSGNPPRRHACPLWSRCPRHHAARELVDARVWVATPASLVHSTVPRPLQEERLRYLELACRMSDLIVVDEADRVQMHLDNAFAPTATLVGRASNSWLDQVAGHKLTELARRGRLQLSAREVEDWVGAVDTVIAATDRIYARLVQDGALRTWITQDYFSALTLHQWLINAWFPDLRARNPAPTPAGTTAEERMRARQRIDGVLDRFRDDPLQQHPVEDPEDEQTRLVNELVRLTLELLHAPHGSGSRERVRTVLETLVAGDPAIMEAAEEHAPRLEFTLLLAALHHRLDFMTVLWQRVEAALNLDAASNALSRRPARDYEPLLPESPMGNVLGFQFQLDERRQGGGQSGELRFFRCNGVGRELLLELPRLPRADGRPGPHVLLLSATSWAGESSRYHVHAPVGAVLRPHPDEVAAILRTEFRKHFLYWPGTGTAIRLSGCEPEQRPQALQQMLHQLAEPDRTLAGAVSPLQQELDDIDDPDRKRLLLLVGSYAEAERAAEYLGTIPEWSGRVIRLVSDDADLDTAWTGPGHGGRAGTLRRGDVARFAQGDGDVLIAPLLAVERGHNIVIPGGKAAIGTVWFLARPHPRPDDISLAVQAINDWAVRQLRDPAGEFRQAALAAGTPHLAGRDFRSRARHKWNRFLTRRLSWTSLPDQEKAAFTWDQLVVMWQVIGRLVRGGVPARVVFVDAAFSPREAGLQAEDTPATSLLAGMRHLLAPYFDDDSGPPAIDKSLVTALYEPLYRALADMD